MRIVEAARLITTGRIDPETLWEITTSVERVTIALLAGRPDYLPNNAKTPVAAWSVMDTRCRSLVQRRAPIHVRRCLPDYKPLPNAFSLKSGKQKTHTEINQLETP
ncbi:hypothetical protein LWC05_02585 [Acetobacter sicerae]|uniref:Uncharacterized protein n=1 Tax=Acetobacter sicerae TaxID=85325 RepID=A0ABS8VQR4_9PROT|nr:hypothetical protein [Acetobacter sicerae]MCE0742785.1 hypothetical protein [Acetobacter sicerae]